MTPSSLSPLSKRMIILIVVVWGYNVFLQKDTSMLWHYFVPSVDSTKSYLKKGFVLLEKQINSNNWAAKHNYWLSTQSIWEENREKCTPELRKVTLHDFNFPWIPPAASTAAFLWVGGGDWRLNWRLKFMKGLGDSNA